jgi:bleomycin hydrolase
MKTATTKRVKKATPRRSAKTLSNGQPKKPVQAGLSSSQISSFRKSFASEPVNRIMRNAVTKTSVASIALNRDAVVDSRHVFSHQLKAGDATSQNASGRCWLFAGLNPMRVKAIERMKLDDKFELSQSYLMFWDKLEKANYMLESILATVDEPIGSRLLNHLLADPIQDGGQWHMFVNLVEKYGVMPKSSMPETDSSSNTRWLNHLITSKLREFAKQLRERSAAGDDVRSLRESKREMLGCVYRMLAIHLGEPPQKFDFQWRDTKGKHQRLVDVTPQSFFAKFVKEDLNSKLCLIHCPQSSKRENEVYTIEYLGNVVEGSIIRYINVSLEVLKASALRQLKAGEAVWFGADVGKMMERDLGLLDMTVYDFDAVYSTSFGLNKAARLDYCQSQMNHAMVFTGVDLSSANSPRKWRVENSWGEKVGDKGFFAMSDEWFDEFVYEVAVDVKHCPAALARIAAREPKRLPPWDPMGALAG